MSACYCAHVRVSVCVHIPVCACVFVFTCVYICTCVECSRTGQSIYRHEMGSLPS